MIPISASFDISKLRYNHIKGVTFRQSGLKFNFMDLPCFNVNTKYARKPKPKISVVGNTNNNLFCKYHNK